MQSATIQSPIGNIKLTQHNNLLVSIEFTDERQTNTKNPFLIDCIYQLNTYFQGKSNSFNISINLKATPFQKQVWKEMTKIPYGKTISYSELANRINHPTAYRAVANTCGKNPLPIIIPCHRVTGKNNLGGFSSGIEKKKWLLEHEKCNLG